MAKSQRFTAEFNREVVRLLDASCYLAQLYGVQGFYPEKKKAPLGAFFLRRKKRQLNP